MFSSAEVSSECNFCISFGFEQLEADLDFPRAYSVYHFYLLLCPRPGEFNL